MNVIVVGDTGGIALDIGGLSYARATSLQLHLADAMSRLVDREGVDFFVGAGDNVSRRMGCSLCNTCLCLRSTGTASMPSTTRDSR